MLRYTSGATPTCFRFTGQRAESGLGLYFFQARWYDASLSRFISADSIIPNPGDPVAWDRYAYVRNNSVNRVDPTGHFDNCSAITSMQCNRDNTLTLGMVKSWTKGRYGVTLEDGDRAWDLQNAEIVYQGLQNTYSTSINTQGATFTLNKNPGHYGGKTSGTNINFNTSTTIPYHNFYHEYAHLINNFSNKQFSNAVDARGFGAIDSDTLLNGIVPDPNWTWGVDAIQAYPDERDDSGEIWADMYANYMSSNINTDEQAGYGMFAFVQELLNPPPPYRNPEYISH